MPRFGFTQEELDALRDQPVFLPGQREVGVVIFHGWSSFPRQVKYIAEHLNKLGYPVSVPMLRGHGTLPEELEKVSAEDWVEDAERAVKMMRKDPRIKKIIVGGTSMGGNLALLVSLKEKVDGIFLLGTPIHFKNHFLIWLSSLIPKWIKKYQKKKYPKSVEKQKELLGYTSYRYFPIKSVRDCLKVVRQSVFFLHKVTAPLIIFQTRTDYLVTRYSPWIIYNAASSQYKKIQWLDSESGNHILISEDTPDFFPVLGEFAQKIEKGEIK